MKQSQPSNFSWRGQCKHFKNNWGKEKKKKKQQQPVKSSRFQTTANSGTSFPRKCFILSQVDLRLKPVVSTNP